MKLTNRYTTNKNYYSYKNDFLGLFKQFGLSVFLDDIECLYRTRFPKAPTEYREPQLFWIYFMVDAYKNNYPVYYISPHFIELAKNTSLPNNWELNDCYYFVKNAIFLLPKTESNFFNNAKVKWLGFHSNTGFKSENFSEMLEWIFGCYQNDLGSSAILPCPFPFTSECFEAGSGYYDKEMLPLARLLPHIFLYMATYQEKAYGLDELNIVSDRSGRVVKGFRQKERLKTPLTIGLQEEKYYRSQIAQSNSNLQGIKKATHWRRGHWRKVNEDKLTWIRPCLINAV